MTLHKYPLLLMPSTRHPVPVTGSEGGHNHRLGDRRWDWTRLWMKQDLGHSRAEREFQPGLSRRERGRNPGRKDLGSGSDSYSLGKGITILPETDAGCFL